MLLAFTSLAMTVHMQTVKKSCIPSLPLLHEPPYIVVDVVVVVVVFVVVVVADDSVRTIFLLLVQSPAYMTGSHISSG